MSIVFSTLLVVASDGCHVFDFDKDAVSYPTSRRIPHPFRDAIVEVADLTGDGLDDVAIATGSDVLIFSSVEAGPLGAELVQEPAE